METPGQTGRRLLAALEDLAAQGAAAVLAGDFDAVAELQARTAAVGEKLGGLAEAWAGQQVGVSASESCRLPFAQAQSLARY